MPQYEVEGTQEAGYVDDLVPEVVQELSEGVLIDRAAVEGEIDLCLRTVRTFWEMEPDQVMRMIGAISARCTELAVHLHRVEGKREWKQIRTLQVNALLAELDRQWKIHSRLVELRRQDLELMR